MGCICGPITQSSLSNDKENLSLSEIDEVNALNVASLSIDIKFNDTSSDDNKSNNKVTKVSSTE